MKAKVWRNRVTIICPACRDVDISRGYTDQRDGGVAGVHTVPFQGEGAWGFNGNVDAPTLTPSLLLTQGVTPCDRRDKFVCHSFVTDGRIQFLSDCTHSLAGQTVDLPEWESPDVG